MVVQDRPMYVTPEGAVQLENLLQHLLSEKIVDARKRIGRGAF